MKTLFIFFEPASRAGRGRPAEGRKVRGGIRYQRHISFFKERSEAPDGLYAGAVDAPPEP